MKEISIIIATYNAGRTLSRCFDSIITQKTEEVELVVIDGSSTDNTMEIVKQYECNIDVFVSEEDNGIYDAWNKGIALSSGKWIMFLGADDAIIQGMLFAYLKIVKEQAVGNLDMINGKSRLTDKEGNVVGHYGVPYVWEEFIRKFLISHGSTLHNRKLFHELGSFDCRYKICGDYEFLLRKKLSTQFVDMDIINMQVGGASTTYKALFETYRIKCKYGHLPARVHLYYLLKGCGGLLIRKSFRVY